MNIIPAQDNQLTAIQSLLKLADLPSEDLSTEMLNHFFVAMNEGGIIGCIGLEVHESNGIVRSLAVSQENQGKGYAKKLVHRIEIHAKSFSLDSLYLLTTTAEQFFMSQGYQVITRESDSNKKIPREITDSKMFKKTCPQSAICLVKKLEA